MKKTILIEGRIFGLIMMLIVMFAIIYFVQRSKAGKVPKVRRVAGLNAIDEAIGRCVELDRPVFCSHGGSTLVDPTEGPQTLAGLSVLSYVAQKCAELGAILWVPVRRPTIWPIAADIVETAYRIADRIEDFKPDNIAFLSSQQHAWASNYLGLMFRERAGANIMIGAYASEAMYLAESGNRAEALQISGTAQLSQLPFFVVSTEYCLIGEEIFAAGAYVSGDENVISTLAGTDVGRIIIVIMMLLGAILYTVGNEALINLIGI